MDYVNYTDDELLRRIDRGQVPLATPLEIELAERLQRALAEVALLEGEEAQDGDDAGRPRESGREEVAANEGRVVLLASKQRHGQARHS